jgi:HAD superfamily hydrolase (TIGR01509 family)
MKTLKALIFDVDGTLAETERDGHLPAFNAAFVDHALPWVWDAELYERLLNITGGKERIRHYAEMLASDLLARADFDQRVRAVHQSKTAHYISRVERGQIALRPGIAELIRAARQAGIRLAIATTTAPENVTALLAASLAPDAPSWFEVIGAGDRVAAKKPAPDIYRWVLEQLRLPAAACLAIEDSENGLQAALAAGLACVITPGEFTCRQTFAGAHRVVSDLATTSLDDLDELLRQTLKK